jgi:hypothetical protein
MVTCPASYVLGLHRTPLQPADIDEDIKMVISIFTAAMEELRAQGVWGLKTLDGLYRISSKPLSGRP